MSEYLHYPTAAHGRIPSFHSYEEEADFWDTHDFTEFSEQTETLKVRSTPGLEKQVVLRFDETTDRTLEAIAQKEEIKKAALVRKIVKEWLRQQQDRHAS